MFVKMGLITQFVGKFAIYFLMEREGPDLQPSLKFDTN